MRSLFLQDSFSGRLSTKDRWFYALIAAFFVSLYLPTMPVINNIVIGLIVVYSFFYTPLAEKKQLLRSRKAVWLMLLFFGLHIFSTFLSHNKDEAVTMLLMRTPLVLFPLAFGLVFINEELKNRIWWLYAVVTTLAALVCLVWALSVYHRSGDAAFLYNDSMSIAIGKQSIYFAMMINMAVFGFVYLLSRKVDFINRPLAYGSILLLLVVHFLLASRISIGLLYSSMLLFAFYSIVKKRKYLEGATLLMGLLIGGFLLVKFFPKTINRFRELGYTAFKFENKGLESHYNMEVTADQWNGANIRLAVWQCGWELAGKHPVFGVQLGDKMDEMIKVYQAKGFEMGVQSKRNMHNNYLDVLVTFGVTGLLIFIAGYIVLPFIGCIKTKDALGGIVVISLAIAMVSESYLDRSLGNVLLGFFIPFILSYKRSDQ